eukprot:3006832-Pyramimonas_sp.AAC.1
MRFRSRVRRRAPCLLSRALLSAGAHRRAVLLEHRHHCFPRRTLRAPGHPRPCASGPTCSD